MPSTNESDGSPRSLLAIGIVVLVALGGVYGFRRLRESGGERPLLGVPRARLTEIEPERLLSSSLPLREGAGEWELVEFTDYDCPPCQEFFHVSEQDDAVPPSVGIRIVHYPLVIHPEAYAKAKYMIQQHLKRRGPEAHRALVSGFIPPAEKVSDGVSRLLLNKQMELGDKIGIPGTPTLFLIHRRQRVYQLQDGFRIAPLLATLSKEPPSMSKP